MANFTTPAFQGQALPPQSAVPPPLPQFTIGSLNESWGNTTIRLSEEINWCASLIGREVSDALETRMELQGFLLKPDMNLVLEEINRRASQIGREHSVAAETGMESQNLSLEEIERRASQIREELRVARETGMELQNPVLEEIDRRARQIGRELRVALEKRMESQETGMELQETGMELQNLVVEQLNFSAREFGVELGFSFADWKKRRDQKLEAFYALMAEPTKHRRLWLLIKEKMVNENLGEVAEGRIKKLIKEAMKKKNKEQETEGIEKNFVQFLNQKIKEAMEKEKISEGEMNCMKTIKEAMEKKMKEQQIEAIEKDFVEFLNQKIKEAMEKKKEEMIKWEIERIQKDFAKFLIHKDKESERVLGARTTRPSTMEDKIRKECDVLLERFESFLKKFGGSNNEHFRQLKAKLEEEKKKFLEKYCYQYKTGNLKAGSHALRGSAVVLVTGGLVALVLPPVSGAVSLGAIVASGVCLLISRVLAKELKDEERKK